MELQQFHYDNKIVKNFLYATIIWGVVGMSVGLLLAFMFIFPTVTDGISWLSFGRLRPLHTNAVIFAFVGNAIFAGVYYSTQRLLKARMFSDALSKINFWGWQLIIVAAAITLPLGFTSSKEYAELEWPIDIMIAIVWVVFGWNLIGTILKRRQRHLYVAIWFYLATFVTVAVLHIFNSLALPVNLFKSYSAYAGVQDALVQWWYGHNAVAFFLTTPFLGLMYYFVPKAANRPVYSYKLSIIHFWSLIFIYIWAGPHHLLYTALPDWAQKLFSENMIAAGNIRDEELDQLCSVTGDLIEHYVKNLDMNAFPNKEDLTDWHNYYCKNQKKNPHLHRSILQMGISEQDKDKYVNEILFEEI